MYKYIKKVLVIDDVRSIEGLAEDYITVARTYEAGMFALKHQGPWDILYLDHDLGQEETGYDIAKFLEEHINFLPKEVKCISSNPVGRKNILQAVESAFKRKGKTVSTAGKVLC